MKHDPTFHTRPTLSPARTGQMIWAMATAVLLVAIVVYGLGLLGALS